jgi:dienelactone hydrolase
MKDIIRNIYTWLIMGALICIILLSVAAINRDDDERDKRTEEGEHTFLTFTPSTISQIYKDDWRVKPRKISGDLTLPPGDGPFPAVVLYHGNFHPEKLAPWFDELIPRLIESGFATFVLDSYTGRKITNTAFNEARLSRAARLADIFQALNMLAKLDEIDENRVGISGSSAGGTTAMLAAEVQIIETSLARGRSFAAHLMVYPSCQTRFRTHLLTGAPMLYLVAENDGYSPAEYCEEYVASMASQGFNVEIEKYTGNNHGWLVDYGVSNCEDCMTFKECGLSYIEDNGHESALDGRVDTKFGWWEYIETLYRDCGTIEVIMRQNPEARRNTLDTTIRFFSDVLKEAE